MKNVFMPSRLERYVSMLTMRSFLIVQTVARCSSNTRSPRRAVLCRASATLSRLTRTCDGCEVHFVIEPIRIADKHDVLYGIQFFCTSRCWHVCAADRGRRRGLAEGGRLTARVSGN